MTLKEVSVDTGRFELACVADLSFLESEIVREKARGLSDLEVALKLFLYDRDVRAVTQRLKQRYAGWRRLGNGHRRAAS